MTRAIRVEVTKKNGEQKVEYAVESDDPQAAFHALNGIIKQQEDME